MDIKAQFSSDVEETRKAINLAEAAVRGNFSYFRKIGNDENRYQQTVRAFGAAGTTP